MAGAGVVIAGHHKAVVEHFTTGFPWVAQVLGWGLMLAGGAFAGPEVVQALREAWTRSGRPSPESGDDGGPPSLPPTAQA